MIHCVTLINFESSDMVLKRLENELILKKYSGPKHTSRCLLRHGRARDPDIFQNVHIFFRFLLQKMTSNEIKKIKAVY